MKETDEKELSELKEILGREFPSLKKTITRNLSASFFLLYSFLEPTVDGMEDSP